MPTAIGAISVEDLTASPASATIDRLVDPHPDFFRKNYLEQGRPAIIALSSDQRPAQFSWTFDRITELVGDLEVPVYDWGEKGPTVDDDFRIVSMPMGEALRFANAIRSTTEQRFAICQLPLESCPALAAEYKCPPFLEQAIRPSDQPPAPFREKHRDALFVSFFRGIHWHNGRDALAQIGEGGKRFVLFSPDDTPHLYPKRFLSSPIAWFDETEAVFCSEIPFEKGLDVDLVRFPRFSKARPLIADVRAGEALFIPSHWWHFTQAATPSIVTVRFWDAPLRRWRFPLAWRSVLMKPYRKYLFRRLRKLGMFSRTVRS
jgi:cupin-like protein